MLTLNQQIKKLKQIQEAHSQLSSFYFGHPADAEDSTALRYNLMVVQIDDGTLSKRTNTTKFNLVFCGKVFSDESNKAEVLSDLQQVALDCYAQFWEYLEDNSIELSADAPMEVLQAVWDTSVWGWQIGITINQFYSRDTCQVPTIN